MGGSPAKSQRSLRVPQWRQWRPPLPALPLTGSAPARCSSADGIVAAQPHPHGVAHFGGGAIVEVFGYTNPSKSVTSHRKSPRRHHLMTIPTTPITRSSAPRCRTRPTRSSTPSANSTWVSNDSLALRDPPDRSRRQQVAGYHAAPVQPTQAEFVGELHRTHVLVSVQMPVDLRVRIPYVV